MKSLPTRRTADAERDFRSILLDVFVESPSAALRVAESIDNTVSAIALNPHLGEVYHHPHIEGLRRSLVNQFRNYSIYYQVLPDEIIVVRVLHNSRDIDSAIATPP